MPIEHKVKQGDCMYSISEEFGFSDPLTILDAPENASFKETHTDLHLLTPGALLVIPDKEWHTIATGSEHRFAVKAKAVVSLPLQLQDADDSSRGSLRYKLVVAGQTFEGETDGDGVLEHEIDRRETKGELTVWHDPDSPEAFLVYELEIGHLDPVEAVTGQQARLNNLGYDVGAVDGEAGERTENAVRWFQIGQDIDVTGELDSDTVGAFSV